MSDIKVSVIVPVYNVESYLNKSLDSLINQTLKDIEIICINDGSTDKSLNILEQYAKKDSRIKIINQENAGTGIARNVGLDMATGEYLAFVDPDDWIELDALAKMYSLAKEKKAKVVQINYICHYKNTCQKFSFAKKVKRLYNYDLTKRKYYTWKVLKKSCLFEHDLHSWAHFFEHKFIKDNSLKFTPTRVVEDHIFVNGAKLLTDKIYFLDEYLYNYRARKGSLVNTFSDNIFCIFNNIELMKQFLRKNNLLSVLQEEFDSYKTTMCAWHYNQVPHNRKQEYLDICKEFLSQKEFKIFLSKIKNEGSFWERIFALKNLRLNAKKYKFITLLGMKFVLNTNSKNKFKMIITEKDFIKLKKRESERYYENNR